MDKLFGQFSLQNILRQMFCGVVFLLPFFLFSAIVAVKEPPVTFQKVCINLHELNLSAAELTFLTIFSIIIGTLIYHLEKNIWSYGLQVLYGLFRNKVVWVREDIITVIISVGVFMVAIFISCYFKNEKLLIIFIFLLTTTLSALVSSLCVNAEITEQTRCMWLSEGEAEGSHMRRQSAENDRKVIMNKVAKWSDFIHCAQSCACAWILGSTFAYVLFEENSRLWSSFLAGLISAASLLVAESFIDWHRWQHVCYILNSGIPSNQKSPPNSDKNKEKVKTN